ncbi:MAG: hypothetical protein JWM99_3910 [Verrucomicrobiales bacterium]|nr:hypothetical protein [Verrucomicrobiales bacterium]
MIGLDCNILVQLSMTDHRWRFLGPSSVVIFNIRTAVVMLAGSKNPAAAITLRSLGFLLSFLSLPQSSRSTSILGFAAGQPIR